MEVSQGSDRTRQKSYWCNAQERYLAFEKLVLKTTCSEGESYGCNQALRQGEGLLVENATTYTQS